MKTIYTTPNFDEWFVNLKDPQGKARIQARIDRMESGHFGDCKHVGGGVYEARIFVGPGYRVYYVQQGKNVIVLLCGGNKSSQQRDIEHAKKLAQKLEE